MHLDIKKQVSQTVSACSFYLRHINKISRFCFTQTDKGTWRGGGLARVYHLCVRGGGGLARVYHLCVRGGGWQECTTCVCVGGSQVHTTASQQQWTGGQFRSCRFHDVLPQVLGSPVPRFPLYHGYPCTMVPPVPWFPCTSVNPALGDVVVRTFKREKPGSVPLAAVFCQFRSLHVASVHSAV